MDLLRDPRRRRWLAWGALALVFLAVNIHRLSTAVLSEELTADFGISAAELGTLHASFFAIYAVTQIPTGVVADRYGPRYVGSGGAVVLSIGAIGFAASNGYVAGFLSRALIGLGSSVIFVTILRFCATWYRTDEFATMTGLTAGIAGLGAVFATTPLALAVEQFGWRETLLGLAGFGFVGAGAVFALARRSPEAAGLEPIENVPDQPAVTLGEAGGHLRELLGDLDQWLLSLIFFSASGTILTIMGLWGVPYLVVVYDMSVTSASTYTLLGAVGILLGSPAVGWISDRIGERLRPMLVGLGGLTLVLAVIPAIGKPPLWIIAVVYFLTGFSLGFAMLSLSLVKERYPPGASGVATATVNGWGFFGATVIPTAMGVVLDRHRTGEIVAGSVAYTEFGYRAAFAITTASLAIAVLAGALLVVRDRS
ncbi:MFS transporter [Halovenus salina]|uniref:MFS transporter n=1 Tax=Halovenus salina TaxID=1510225 RepID=UPI002260ECE8|nr:MFS transporter [Halovenus salina]